jgi:hypothetical protein
MLRATPFLFIIQDMGLDLSTNLSELIVHHGYTVLVLNLFIIAE